jgi:hypothetical protein
VSSDPDDRAVPGVHVIELHVENDVEAELELHKRPGAMTTLGFIADQGGEVGWNWNGGVDPHTKLWKPLTPATRELVTDLINAGLLIEREYVTHAAQAAGTGKLTLRLTDQGRNVVSKHRQRRVVASGPRPVTAGEVAALTPFREPS